MLADPQRDAHIQKNAQAIEELTIKIETLNRDVDALLTELNVTAAQLTTFLGNQNNFTEGNWKTILDQRKALDEKLMRELVNVANPLKTKKAYADRVIPPHWLFVR